MKMEEPELTVVKGLGMIMENPDYERLAHNLQDSDFHYSGSGTLKNRHNFEFSHKTMLVYLTII